jgi:hypothetical protein
MPDDWRNFLLRAIGAPENPITLGSLTLWAHSEGVAPTCHNHLAATDRLIGDRPGPASAVFCYPSEGAMIALYADKLRSGLYQGIYDALRRGAQYAAIWKAINASPWCRGCQGGHYPTALYSAAFGDVAPPLSGDTQRFADPPTPPPGRDANPTSSLPSGQPGPRYDDLHQAWDRLTGALAHDVPHAYREIQRARKGIHAAVRLPRP